MITFDEAVLVMNRTLEKQGMRSQDMPATMFAQAVAGILNAVVALEELGWSVEKTQQSAAPAVPEDQLPR